MCSEINITFKNLLLHAFRMKVYVLVLLFTSVMFTQVIYLELF